MDTHVHLFRRSQPLITSALDEPCLTLIRNDTAFGLLIADGAQSQVDGGLVLERPRWFRTRSNDWTMDTLTKVTLLRGRQGLWVAVDDTSKRLLPQPSRQPYHVVFITEDEQRLIDTALTARDGKRVFAAAQEHFGRLPGFDFADGVLISPRDYATAPVIETGLDPISDL